MRYSFSQCLTTVYFCLTSLFSARLRWESAIRSDIQGPIWPPWLPQTVCSTVLLEHLLSYYCRTKYGGSVAATVIRVKLTEVNCSLPSKLSPGSCKPSINSRVPKCYIRQILPLRCCLGGGTECWYFLVCHLHTWWPWWYMHTYHTSTQIYMHVCIQMMYRLYIYMCV